jgi:hypothetical protein
MVKFFACRACRYALVLLLFLTACWLLLQQYASYKVQQQLADVNQQYQRLAAQHRLPLLQLTAKNSRFIPWQDVLEIQQLELTLPNGAALLQLSGLKLHGLLQLKPESLATSASLPGGFSYQLSWLRLELSPALQLLLPTELQRQLKPLAGVLSWQQHKQQLHSQIRLQMAELLLLQTRLELNILPPEAMGEPQQIQLNRISLDLQQQLLPALQPWLARQGFASESLLFNHWQQQLASCSALPPLLWQAFLAWQQQPGHLVADWRPEPALLFMPWPQWGCPRS